MAESIKRYGNPPPISGATDFLLSLGPLALTLRLRRLADRLTEDGRRFYAQQAPDLEPNWYALWLLLRERGPLSVTDAAHQLRLRHPSVVRLSRAMEQAGLLRTAPDPRDGRRRVLSLSRKAWDQGSRLSSLWSAFEETLTRLTHIDAPMLMRSLEALENALGRRSFLARVEATAQGRTSREGTPEPRVGGAKGKALSIRPTKDTDRKAVLTMARGVIRSADTYAFDPKSSDALLWRYWSPKAPGQGFVATRGSKVVGTFVLRPNRPGAGAHVAGASFVVRADQRGQGVGRQLGVAAIREAERLGYEGMQFNAVVSTNEPAVRLWRSLGFAIVGTVPAAFALPDGRKVGLHIMYRPLGESPKAREASRRSEE